MSPAASCDSYAGHVGGGNLGEAGPLAVGEAALVGMEEDPLASVEAVRAWQHLCHRMPQRTGSSHPLEHLLEIINISYTVADKRNKTKLSNSNSVHFFTLKR